MAQKRMISSLIWEDENFGKLSFQARLLFLGLITNADDDGYIRANDSYLRSTVFIYDDIELETIKNCLQEIIKNLSSVHVYEFAGNRYLHFVKWTTFQTLRSDRKKDTMMPICPQCERPLSTNCQPIDNQLSAEDKLSKYNLSETNGREEKESEKEKGNISPTSSGRVANALEEKFALVRSHSSNATKLIIVSLFLVGFVSFPVLHKPVYAQSTNVTRMLEDARFVQVQREHAEKIRIHQETVKRVAKLLKNNNSPLTDSAESFVNASEQYGVSYKLLLAIAWKESSFGKHTPKYPAFDKQGKQIGTYESNNAFGWGIHQSIAFNSWNDGIFTVAKGLAQNYDHTDIRRTIMKYAPPSENNTELYIDQVKYFVSKI